MPGYVFNFTSYNIILAIFGYSKYLFDFNSIPLPFYYSQTLFNVTVGIWMGGR